MSNATDVDDPAPSGRPSPPGTPAARWAEVISQASARSLADMARELGVGGRGTRLLVLAAHPDDETLGAGRLISQWSRSVGPSFAVLATFGEACVDGLTPRPPGLAQRRAGEWRRALSALGVSDDEVVGLPDGRLEEHRSELEEALLEAAYRLLNSDTGGDAVLAAVYAGDPHPDHAAVGRAAEVVADRLGLPLVGYPVWLTYWTQPHQVPAESLWRIAVDDRAEWDRSAALECYTSQLKPLAPDLDPVVPLDLLDHHREQLVLPRGRSTR